MFIGESVGVIEGHSVFLKKFNFEFGNKFDYLICHSVICNYQLADLHYKDPSPYHSPHVCGQFWTETESGDSDFV